MAWGARSGVDDLLLRLQQPATASSLCVLSFRKLLESDVQKLASAIAHNTLLQELFLSGHELSAAGVAAFADALAVNETLQHLSLGNDTLGDAGVATLCAGIKRNPQSAVATWDLEHKSLGVNGAASLGELLATSATGLREVNLARNAIGDDGVRALVVDGLARNSASSLTTLTLSETGVSGVALDHLAELLALPHCSLQTLQLSFNDLSHGGSDAFFSALGRNSSLKNLYLKETKLSDAQATALANALRTNTTLLEVDVSDNALSAAVSVAFADALVANKTVLKLVLSGNKCGDDGASALGRTLGDSNSTLTLLDLADNALTYVGIQSLLLASHLQSLRVFNNRLGDGLPHILPTLVANTSIVSLDLGANALHGRLSVVLFDQLHSHASLTTLEMGGNSLGDLGHAALERLRAANPKLDVAADKNAQNEDGGMDA